MWCGGKRRIKNDSKVFGLSNHFKSCHYQQIFIKTSQIFPAWCQIQNRLEKKWGETGRHYYLKWKDLKTGGLFGIWHHLQEAN